MSSTTVPTPPMLSGGLPVLGHALEMLRDRDGLFKRGHAAHGDLFAIKLGPLNTLVVTGAEYNRIFYTETDKALNMQEGYAFLKEAIGEVLFTASKEDYYNQRPVLQEVFKRERMVGYIEAMNLEVQRWLDSLGQYGEIDVTQEMLRLTQQVAGRSFIGKDYEQELGPNFWEWYQAISASLDPVLPPTLPLPKFWRRDQSKKKIAEVLNKVIQKRRENPGRYNDLISTLLTTPLKDGSILPDASIVIMFMGLIFAGHETTAGQAAWLIALLLQHPDYLKLVKAEISREVEPNKPIDASVLSRLEHIYWAVDETTRFRPSADTQIRTVEAPITVGPYQIPAGWRVMVSGATSHFMPDVFTNPERFDPLRYSPERSEGKNPFAIIGFGGGIHKCTGMNFAKNEMAVISALFFQQFEAELVSSDIRVVAGAGANHPSAVRVRYHRKTSIESLKTAESKAEGCPHPQPQTTSEG
ncbi:MAG: cytochrome P450 [Anaerolineae bacterium]|nr:cytochrome P450 [Anaerolineae bacterium]